VSTILLEDVFAAGACVGTLIGWWAGKSAADADTTELMLAVAMKLEERENV